MDKQSERQKLAARYEEMRAGGLVDVKFYLRNPGEATVEQVCGELNAMYAAVESGNCKPLIFS